MFGWNSEDLTQENILSKINQFDIFYFYIEGFKEIGVPFCSELREDNNPSCCISEYNEKLYYKDFGDGTSVNCFGYVKVLLNTDYYTALQQISVDFDLGIHTKSLTPYRGYKGMHHPDRSVGPGQGKRPKIIQIRSRSWEKKRDKRYWKDRYGLGSSILDHYQVKPVEAVWLNGKMIMIDNYRSSSMIYAYRFGPYKYKIMAPYFDQKWLSNISKKDIQGHDQLPWIGNLLVITKSLKDVMCLYQLGVPSIAPQSETELISDREMRTLKYRFKNIIILFDNDPTGISGSNKYLERHPDLIDLKITQDISNTSKDISELIEHHGWGYAQWFTQEYIMVHDDRIEI